MAPLHLQDVDSASDVTECSEARSYYDPNLGLTLGLPTCDVQNSGFNTFVAMQQQQQQHQQLLQQQQQLQLQLKMQTFMATPDEYDHDVTAATTPRSVTFNPSEMDLYQGLMTSEAIEDFGAHSARDLMASESSSTIVTVDTMSECSFSMAPTPKSYPVVVISPGTNQITTNILT